MSKKQPGCDGSHVGTKFSPLKFTLDEKVAQLNLCGCKLSKQAPFCDGVCCLKLLKGEALETPEMAGEVEADAAGAQQAQGHDKS